MRIICLSVFLLVNALLLAQEPQSEFRPVTGPVTEQLPAAPLVIAAYAFVWAAFLAYAWTMWRKLGKVEKELNALSARVSGKQR